MDSGKHISAKRKMASKVSEGDGGEDDLSDSQLLDSKRSWVWEHFKPYKVKTLASMVEPMHLNISELETERNVEIDSGDGEEDDASEPLLKASAAPAELCELSTCEPKEDDASAAPVDLRWLSTLDPKEDDTRSQMEATDEPSYDIENPKDPLPEELPNLLPLSPLRCIYRVPERLRRGNEKAYTPRVVSIGPLHHGKKHLKAMEEHKIRYLRHFLRRTRERVSFSDYKNKIKAQERRLRCFYAESIEFRSDEFVRIVLVDAAFVIEFLLRNKFVQLRGEADCIFNKPMMVWDVRPDLRLLENQLPFFILQDLFNTLLPSSHQLPSLLQISYDFFKSEIDSKGKEENFKQILSFGHVQHFVDLLRILYRPLKSKKTEEENTTPTPNVTELRHAGVKFAVGTGNDLFDIKFSSGRLEIPKLTVHDTTELTLRNLLAFEQCHQGEENYLTNYIVLMARLVKTSEDVDLLVEKEVIENWLGDTQKISTLLHDLGNGVMVSKHYYAPLCEELHNYCSKRRHKWMANLRQNYFTTPWSTISVVAAVILLLLTLTQTVCSIISVA